MDEKRCDLIAKGFNPSYSVNRYIISNGLFPTNPYRIEV